jgi:hypothetical protein
MISVPKYRYLIQFGIIGFWCVPVSVCPIIQEEGPLIKKYECTLTPATILLTQNILMSVVELYVPVYSHFSSSEVLHINSVYEYTVCPQSPFRVLKNCGVQTN